MLAYGSRGEDVKELQSNLNTLGFNCGKVDGVFGGKTLGAVKRFQQANGLKVDGLVGDKTQGAIYLALKPKSGVVEVLKVGSKGLSVSALQQKLADKGYNPGPIDGIFGTQTLRAVIALQRDKKIAQDGLVGPQTLNALNGQNESVQPTPAPAPQPQQPAKIGKKIVVRQGHGDKDPGAVSGQFIEKDMNEVAAQKLFNDLIQKGFNCIYISGSDLNAGIKQANDWGADLFVSVHHNAGKGDGYEVIHTINPNSPGVKLAQLIAEEFNALGQNAHGQGVISKQGKSGDYYGEIRYTNMPAVICEFAYIDSSDVSIVDTKQELETEGDAIYRAICKFYQI